MNLVFELFDLVFESHSCVNNALLRVYEESLPALKALRIFLFIPDNAEG